MRLIYFKNGQKHTITSSNNDVAINEVRNGNRTIVRITANEEIILHKADVSYPCHINYKDL